MLLAQSSDSRDRRSSPEEGDAASMQVAGPGEGGGQLCVSRPFGPAVPGRTQSGAPRMRDGGGGGSAGGHLVHELLQVEVVAPGGDLAVLDLEGAHDGQLDLAGRHHEDVDALGEHDGPVGHDVPYAEVDLLGAAGETGDERLDRVATRDRLHRDVVVYGVVGEVFGDLVGAHLRPRGAEPADDLDRVVVVLGHGSPPGQARSIMTADTGGRPSASTCQARPAASGPETTPSGAP